MLLVKKILRTLKFTKKGDNEGYFRINKVLQYFYYFLMHFNRIY